MVAPPTSPAADANSPSPVHTTDFTHPPETVGLATVSVDAAHRDSLTGVMNRTALTELLDQELSTDSPVSLLVIDLDEFGVVNQALGHEFGDKLLRATAKRLQSVFDDRLFRIRGDEFAVLLPTTIASQLDEIAETILSKCCLLYTSDAADE